MVLAKIMAGPFVLAPSLYALARSWRAGRSAGRLIRNVLLATAAAVAMASVWWGPHLDSSYRYLTYYGWGEGAQPYDLRRARRS